MCIQKCSNYALNCITKIEHTLLKQDHWQWLCVDLGSAILTWKTEGTSPTRDNKRFGSNLIEGNMYTFLKLSFFLLFKYLSFENSLIYNECQWLNAHANILRKLKDIFGSTNICFTLRYDKPKYIIDLFWKFSRIMNKMFFHQKLDLCIESKHILCFTSSNSPS